MSVIKKKDFESPKTSQDITPGRMLKELRELRELTQQDLAAQTRISQSNISAMENNVSQIGRDRAIKLARVLKVHPAVILFPDFEIPRSDA